jgi:type IV pilus assembly protein PilM
MLFFPKPAIGLDISDSSIEAVYVVKKGDRLVLASYGRVVLPPGLIVDGQILKMAELSVILRKLLAEQMTAPLPAGPKRVVFALPETKVFSHVFEVPRAVDEHELAQTLAVEADGYFPYNHGEMISGLSIIDEQPDSKQVFFAAVQRDALAQYLELFKQSNLEVAVAEGEATSMARAVFQQGEPEAALLVDIGARVTTLSIFDHNGVQFSETLPLAGDAFTTAVAGALNIPFEAAEDLKRSKGIGDELELPAVKALTAKIDELAANLERAVDFYETRSKRQVKLVYFCGGSMLLPGMFEYVSGKFSNRARPIESHMADPLQNLAIDPALDAIGVHGRSVLLPTAIGLGLRGAGIRKFAEIDFLPGAQKTAAHEAQAARTKPVAPAPKPLTGVKPLKTPVSRHWPKHAKTALLVLAGLAVIVLAWAAAFLLVPRIKSLFSPSPAPAARSVKVAFDFTVGPDATSLPDNRLQAAYQKLSVEETRNFQRPATTVEGKSQGQIVIHNDGTFAQTLIPTTRFVSEGGITFRLDSRVTVKARGTATVAVTADQPGVSGDVAPGRWIIPGLPVAQQAKTYGVSDVAMTGGKTTQTAPVTQAELDQAQAGLVTSAETELRQRLAEGVSAGYRYLDATYRTTATTVLTAPKVGDLVASYDLKISVEATGAAYNEADLSQLVTNAASAASGGVITVGTIGALTPVVTSSDPASGTAVLHLETSVSLK